MQYTYAWVMSHLDKWFMSRWWDLIASKENKMDYINLAIQDIYNEDNATFTYETETLTWTLNGNNNSFTTTFWIRKIQKAFYVDSQWNIWIEIKPTLFPIKWECELKFEWKQILTHKEIDKIIVVYIKEYEFAKYPEDLNNIIPIPNRYLPALLKLAFDWASPINLMKDEIANVDFYGHWMTRLNKLVQEDWLTEYLDVSSDY